MTTTYALEPDVLTKAIAPDISVQSSGTAETGEFFIDPSSLPVLMDLLTNMYSDPEKSVVQEYISNAIDSHTEAGTTRPIEVSTPSFFSQTLTVTDYGTGMSIDDLKKIYSGYGVSTKRQSLDAIGNFGLGCKSALAIAPSFTVTAIKNGWKSVMVVTRSPDGGSDTAFPTHTETDEPTGVSVSIPIPRERVVQVARNVSSFAENLRPGVILVDGKPVESIYESGYYIDEISTLIRPTLQYWDTRLEVNVGGIVYPVHLPSADNRSIPVSVVVDVPIGSVDFTPSRDSLRYTTRTTAYLRNLTDTISNAIPLYMDQKFLETSGMYKSVQFARTMNMIITKTNNPAVKQKLRGLSSRIDVFDTAGDKFQPSPYGIFAPKYSTAYLILDSDEIPRGLLRWVKRWNDMRDSRTPRIDYLVPRSNHRAVSVLRKMHFLQVSFSQVKTHNDVYLAKMRETRAPRETSVLYDALRSLGGYIEQYQAEELEDVDVIITTKDRGTYNLFKAASVWRPDASIAVVWLNNKKHSALLARLKKTEFSGEVFSDDEMSAALNSPSASEHIRLVTLYRLMNAYDTRGFFNALKHVVRVSDPDITRLIEIVTNSNISEYTSLTSIVHSRDDDLHNSVHAIMEKYPLFRLDNPHYSSVDSDTMRDHLTNYVNDTYDRNKDN